MENPKVWVTTIRRKKGVKHQVRWIEPLTGKNRGQTFRRMEDARVLEAKLKKQIREKDYNRPIDMKFDEWVKLHLAHLKTATDLDLSEKTIAGHKEALTAIANICKPKTILDITPALIRVFRQRQLENGLARRTINKHIAAIRSALSYAVRMELIPSNKLLGPHRLQLREEENPPRILTAEEVSLLMIAAINIQHKAAISLAYYHGLRRREICNLQWEDIDFEDKLLKVIDRPNARTKTRRSRVVFLRHEAENVLLELKKVSVEDLVFPKSFYWSFDKWFPAIVKRAGLSDIIFHDLRRTCNTLMKNAGVSAEVAMQILGHSTFRVNQRHYTGVLTKEQERAINSLPSVG